MFKKLFVKGMLTRFDRIIQVDIPIVCIGTDSAEYVDIDLKSLPSEIEKIRITTIKRNIK